MSLRQTVSEVMKQIASTVNQEATAPTIDGDEYNLWLQYLNRAQQEWSQAYDWESTRVHYWPTVTGVSTASITLPFTFKKLAGPVKLFGNGKDKPDIYSYAIDEDDEMYGSQDLFVELTGDVSTGKTLVFNPRSLSSGASLEIEMFAAPSTLSGASQIVSMEDPQFLIDRTIAFIFEARSDPRFQIEETKARERLLTMIDNSNDEKFSSYAATSYIPSTFSRSGFRVGRD